MGYYNTMDVQIRKYLASIGRTGGRRRSHAKVRAARKNGALGGRPRIHREATAWLAAKEVISGEDWRIAFMNFVDGFRRRPSYSLIRIEPRALRADPRSYALLQSICIQLCLEHGLTPKGWLALRAYLDKPWFVSGIKSLYATALKESPIPFRKNNIFVLGNFMSRV